MQLRCGSTFIFPPGKHPYGSIGSMKMLFEKDQSFFRKPSLSFIYSSS
ncbi:hypothetical protein HMPREF6123_0326 [Oribacterium sinus F0268]|uniref:Uncharacterized protein n=1 Tax=Oribacterium sinus F0268 TaxID=585501 RepID=C2KV07_9FIRM|nr:hypothetical protein HMPREF6123_0326 [Oribacterium sinus F0268]